ncbi:hypothetical protein [Arthrobacter monumenti]
MSRDPEPQVPAPHEGDDGEEQKSWAHQLTVGVALIVVSLFFFPEGIGALNGDSGNFLFRADDGKPDVFFGSLLVLLGTVMVIGGTFLIVRGLRKRKAELDDGGTR